MRPNGWEQDLFCEYCLGVYNTRMSDGYGASLGSSTVPFYLPMRDPCIHKHQVGRVVVVAGDHGMEGAGWLTALGALKSGVGLVYLYATPLMMGQVGYPEVLKIPRPTHDTEWAVGLSMLQPHAVVVGPGLTPSSAPSVRAVMAWALDHQCPVVVDAGALSVVADFPPHSGMILTPHEGERRTHGWDPIPPMPWVMVAKGAPTTVYHADGSWVCPAGNPGMASAGMGDVLSGVMAGVVAQFRELPLIDRVCAAVWAHSHAADGLAQHQPIGFLASDVAFALPSVWAMMVSHD